MGEQFDRLKTRLTDINNLRAANGVLAWDQHTYMPPGGARARAEQMATLSRIAHDLFIADETGELLDAAAAEIAGLPEESDEASLVRVTRIDFDKARRVPSSLMAEIRRHAGLANPVWVQARANDDFASFAPYLAETVRLSRELAEHLGYQQEPYDALLDQFEPGMLASQVDTIFTELKAELVPLVAAIAERAGPSPNSVLHQPFEEPKQEEFGRMVVERFGYDFTRGRQDRTVHPFATAFSVNDVRITTRFESDFLSPALFGTLHEAGHGMYEQGVAESLEGTPLADAASLGVHESQSRLWENVVGRSRPFWEHFYPGLQSIFPRQLADTPLDGFYRAINAVEPSFIRVEADEVTYNLHIMLRFEMERDLIEGRYPVTDAPQVWNDKMESYLGIRPPSDPLGMLQDTHWSSGLMGYFPTYSLGNILSVQLFDAARRAIPEIPEQIGRGEFGPLHGWLIEHVYRHGRKFQPAEVIRRATGEELQTRSYLAYLKDKFGAIYGL